MTKLMRFRVQGEDRLGVVAGDAVIDVHRIDQAIPPEPLAFLRGGAPVVAAAAEAVAYALSVPDDVAARQQLVFRTGEVEPLLPVPNPPKVICIARNFDAHAKEANKQVSDIPILFVRFASTLIPDGAPIIVPKVSHQVDYEGELAFVVGTPGRYISRDDAMNHVAGYSVFNDVSVRDYQFRVSQYTGGKNFNNSGPCGPVLALIDEGLDPDDLQIITKLNGEVMQDGSTSEMVFDIPAIIEHISEFIELEIGDVVAMGTPAGVGFTRNPARFLTPGDTISVEIPGIGMISNPVIADPFA